MKRWKKYLLLIVVTLLTCSACRPNMGKESNFPNKELVQGLIRMNQYFLAQSKMLVGDVVISARGKGSYEGSNFQIQLRSSNTKNTVTLNGNVSSQTALFLIDSIASTKLKESGIDIDLATVSQEYKIGETGNMSAQFVTINEDMLTPFFKTNKLYFETEENQIVFAKGLSKQIIATNTEVIRDKGIFTTYTLEVQADSLAAILPLQLPQNSAKTHMRIIQNQETKDISRLDVVVYEDRIANNDRTLEFDLDVSLQFHTSFEEGKYE